MKIIFYAYSGVLSASVAAAFFLGILPPRQVVTRQLSEVPFFGANASLYQIYEYGRDYLGNEVFSLGVGKEMVIVPKAIRSFLEIHGFKSHELKMVNTMIPLGYPSRIGERIVSLGGITTGTSIALMGLRTDYHDLIRHVEQEISDLRTKKENKNPNEGILLS